MSAGANWQKEGANRLQLLGKIAVIAGSSLGIGDGGLMIYSGSQ